MASQTARSTVNCYVVSTAHCLVGIDDCKGLYNNKQLDLPTTAVCPKLMSLAQEYCA